MIKLKQSSSNPSGIRFPGDTTRSFSFRAVARPKDAKAKVTYSIQSAGAAFSHNDQTTFTEEVDILAAESIISRTLGFTKDPGETVLQVLVNARVDEVGGDSGFDVFWVVPVLQAPVKAAKANVVGLLAVDPGAAFLEAARNPLDRSDLEHARRVLQTLQAGVDAALATDSLGSDDLSDEET